MNKKLKIISAVFFSIIFICLGGCANTKPRSLSGKTTIPDSGIVEQDIFEQLISENEVAVFAGESNGIRYEWTMFGNDIPESKALNLAVKFNDNNEDNRIAFELCSDEDFGFRPMISIYLNEIWDAQSASVYSEQNGVLSPVCSASITKGEVNAVNFTVPETYGKYVVIADEGNMNDGANIVYTKAVTEVKEQVTVTTAAVSEKTEADSSEAEQPDDQEIYEEEPETENEGGRVYSDGSATEQDKYLTDPVPEGKPMPVEPEDAKVNESRILTCTFSIECTTILNNISDLEPEKLDVLPSDGIIFDMQTVEFKEGESVFDVLQRICKENNIHMEASWTPIYNSAYVEGIHNLYEFDCGSLSGWMYRVNGWYPNYGCSRYQLAEGDVVEWRFTCDLGKDVGCEWMSGT